MSTLTIELNHGLTRIDTDTEEVRSTFRFSPPVKVPWLFYPYYNHATPRTGDKDLDCGGKAQRRHRFSSASLQPKAAWRFASRRSPKHVVAAQAAFGSSVSIRG